MADAFNLYAYRRDDVEFVGDDRRDGIPRWNLDRAVAWALDRGNDTVLIERAGAAVGQPGVIHHVCNDPSCPGGCGGWPPGAQGEWPD